jgi:ABC-type Fe3+ transport system permease subunit
MWRERSTARGEGAACYKTCNQVELPWLVPRLLAAVTLNR